MQKHIVDHFKKADPILYSIVETSQPIEPLSKSDNLFSDLCEAIINQQLSDKTAKTIFERFKKLFPDEIIIAVELIKIPDEKIRGIGTSWKKVAFMKNLANKVISTEINLEKLEKLEDEMVIEELTKLHGIGRWTAETFLMFSLAREDVFSAGDLGLRRALQKLYKLKKEPSPKQIEKLSKKWSPYRTYAAQILWRSME